MDRSLDERRREALAAVAPGTPLRDGLERILRGQTGGLIVLGYNRDVEELCSGGFELDVDFSATRLRELAKMDGAIVLSDDHKIVRAAVHLVPDPAIPTDEAGTRHRTAQRVARQTGLPIIAISKSMRIIALYLDGIRYVLEESAAILSKANQALATLERYKHRLDEVSGTLSALEIEDLVTVRDVAAVVQRLEMVRRISDEIKGYVVELGTDGRLLSLQLDELVAGVDSERELVIRDYLPAPSARRQKRLVDAMHDLDTLSGNELWTSRPSPRSSATTAPTSWTARSAHADSACSPRSPACPRQWWTAWSATSAACRSCWRPASTICRRWAASASPAPAASARACPASPNPPSSNATSNPTLTI